MLVPIYLPFSRSPVSPLGEIQQFLFVSKRTFSALSKLFEIFSFLTPPKIPLLQHRLISSEGERYEKAEIRKDFHFFCGSYSGKMSYSLVCAYLKHLEHYPIQRGTLCCAAGKAYRLAWEFEMDWTCRSWWWTLHTSEAPRAISWGQRRDKVSPMSPEATETWCDIFLISVFTVPTSGKKTGKVS